MATEIQDLFPDARNAPEVRAINDRCRAVGMVGRAAVQRVMPADRRKRAAAGNGCRPSGLKACSPHDA